MLRGFSQYEADPEAGITRFITVLSLAGAEHFRDMRHLTDFKDVITAKTQNFEEGRWRVGKLDNWMTETDAREMKMKGGVA